MATSFKNLTNADKALTKTKLHEAIPITGSLVSGTYQETKLDINVKDFSHNYFQSVWDYPYLSSSANHILDISAGYSPDGDTLSASANTDNVKKVSLYNSMAALLMGYDSGSNIQRFDLDGDHATTSDKMDNVYFINFSRLTVKDEIKKGSFKLTLGLTGSDAVPRRATFNGDVFSGARLDITDPSGSDGYYVNSPAGEYGELWATSSLAARDVTPPGSGSQKVGLIFYQAGIAVISSSVFTPWNKGGILANEVLKGQGFGFTGSGEPILPKANDDDTPGAAASFTGSTITAMSNAFRNRVYNVQFNNTTELNSTIYFCRAHASDFNYSTNPTYLSASQIIVKAGEPTNQPVSYVTSIGLYSATNQLLAVAKLSEPIKKTPNNEVTFRVRLDY